MRILHTEWSDGWGGQERRIVSEMIGMVARGHVVTLAARPLCRIREHADKAGIPVLTLPMQRALDCGSIFALRRFLTEQRVEVVNTHSGVDSWIGSLAAKWAGTPVLLRTRHLNLPLRRSWLNFVHHLPDRIITCGEAIRAELISQGQFPAEQLVSIPTGIDFDTFRPQHGRSEVRKSLGLSESDRLVLMVGIIRTVKGNDIALKAFQRIAPEFPQAHLILAGDGPWEEAIEQLASGLGVARQVHFLGFRDDVADLMGASDLLLLTSRSEGVPQAVTQAMRLELPVVATRVGGVPELIAHEENGLLVPPEDPEATASAIRRLLKDPDLAKRIAGLGRARVETRFSLKTMLDRTEQLCLQLLAEKRIGTS